MAEKTKLPAIATVAAPKLSKQDIDRIAERCGCSSSYVARWYYNHDKVNAHWRQRFTEAMVEVIAEYRPLLLDEIKRIDGAIAKLQEVKTSLLERMQTLPS